MLQVSAFAERSTDFSSPQRCASHNLDRTENEPHTYVPVGEPRLAPTVFDRYVSGNWTGFNKRGCSGSTENTEFCP